MKERVERTVEHRPVEKEYVTEVRCEGHVRGWVAEGDLQCVRVATGCYTVTGPGRFDWST